MIAGDVLPSGAIVIDDRSMMFAGRAMVSEEQASAAAEHGWEILAHQGDRVMIGKGDDEGPVVRL